MGSEGRLARRTEMSQRTLAGSGDSPPEYAGVALPGPSLPEAVFRRRRNTGRVAPEPTPVSGRRPDHVDLDRELSSGLFQESPDVAFFTEPEAAIVAACDKGFRNQPPGIPETSGQRSCFIEERPGIENLEYPGVREPERRPVCVRERSKETSEPAPALAV
jgi:hypothetical protein